MYVHHSTWWTPPLSPLFHVWLQKLHGFIILHHKIPSFHMNSQFFPIAIRWCPRVFSCFFRFSPSLSEVSWNGAQFSSIFRGKKPLEKPWCPHPRHPGVCSASPVPPWCPPPGVRRPPDPAGSWRPDGWRRARRRNRPGSEISWGFFHGILHGKSWLISMNSE